MVVDWLSRGIELSRAAGHKSVRLPGFDEASKPNAKLVLPRTSSRPKSLSADRIEFYNGVRLKLCTGEELQEIAESLKGKLFVLRIADPQGKPHFYLSQLSSITDKQISFKHRYGEVISIPINEVQSRRISILALPNKNEPASHHDVTKEILRRAGIEFDSKRDIEFFDNKQTKGPQINPSKKYHLIIISDTSRPFQELGTAEIAGHIEYKAGTREFLIDGMRSIPAKNKHIILARLREHGDLEFTKLKNLASEGFYAGRQRVFKYRNRQEERKLFANEFKGKVFLVQLLGEKTRYYGGIIIGYENGIVVQDSSGIRRVIADDQKVLFRQFDKKVIEQEALILNRQPNRTPVTIHVTT